MERDIASKFNTRRTPLSGGNGFVTRSDSLHERLFIECKMSTRGFAAPLRIFAEAEEQAKAENKVPLLIFKAKGKHDNMVLLRLSDIKAVARELKDDGDPDQPLSITSGSLHKPVEGS